MRNKDLFTLLPESRQNFRKNDFQILDKKQHKTVIPEKKLSK